MMKKLAHDLDRYFEKTSTTIEVALTDLIPGIPHAVEKAAEYMALAAEGDMRKRGPISVVERARGGYTVVAGNSTLAVAIHSGWPTIYADVVTHKVGEYSEDDESYSTVLAYCESQWDAESYVDSCANIYLTTSPYYLLIEEV